MKYLLTLILGLLLGAILGVVALYLNPLTLQENAQPGAGGWRLTYGSPIIGGLAFTHGGQSRLPSHPAGIPELWENTINKAALSVIPLSAPDGQRGVASRVSVPSEATEFLRRGFIMTDHWLVTFPNEGSLFVDSDSNLWPFVKRDVLPVWFLGRPWDGPRDYSPTAGPGLGNVGLVQGASGGFAERSGSSFDRYHISVFNTQRGPEQFEAELLIDLPEPSAPDQQ